jgi:hypothetical protein
MAETSISDKDVRKQLKILEANVHAFLANMDVVMAGQKSMVERGELIGKLCNDLDMANQIAARFGLGQHRVRGKLRKVK